jgi:hypothetical protein
MSMNSARRRVTMLLRNARRRPSNLPSLRRAAESGPTANESHTYSSYRRTPASSLSFDGSETPLPTLKVASNRRDGD